MGTLDLNNSNSSPEGSTKIAMLIAIGHSYLCTKLQLSISTDSKVIKGLVGLDGFGRCPLKFAV